MNSRIAQIITEHNSTVSILARGIQVQRVSITRWINGSQQPNSIYLRRIADFWPDVDLHYLVTGIKREDVMAYSVPVSAKHTGRRVKYSDEEIAYLLSNYRTMPTKTLAHEVSKRFGVSRDQHAISQYCNRTLKIAKSKEYGSQSTKPTITVVGRVTTHTIMGRR